MNEENFQEVMDRVIELYERGEFATAFNALDGTEQQFPLWATSIQYTRMCLASRMGDTPLALSAFKEMVDSGGWFWQTNLREDGDLRNLQGLPDFEQMAAICAERQSLARSDAEPKASVYEPRRSVPPVPLLLSLHGNSSTAESSEPYWRPATQDGWLLVLPDSTQTVGPKIQVWDDRDWTFSDVEHHYHALNERYPIDPRRNVIGGFSMGATAALRLALAAFFPITGFIAVAPFLPDIAVLADLARVRTDHRLRGYLIAGEQDGQSIDGIRELHALLESLGFACAIEIHKSLGHAYPEAFGESLARALRFVQGEET